MIPASQVHAASGMFWPFWLFGSNPNPALSLSGLRNVSKSKDSKMFGLSIALKSRLNAEAFRKWLVYAYAN